MLGNSHVQFSGGWARATASGYPSNMRSNLSPVAEILRPLLEVLAQMQYTSHSAIAID